MIVARESTNNWPYKFDVAVIGRRPIVWPTCDLGKPRRDATLPHTRITTRSQVSWLKEDSGMNGAHSTTHDTHARARSTRTLPGHQEDAVGQGRGIKKKRKNKWCSRNQTVFAAGWFGDVFRSVELVRWRQFFKARSPCRLAPLAQAHSIGPFCCLLVDYSAIVCCILYTDTLRLR